MEPRFCLICKKRPLCKEICERLDKWLKKNVERYQREMLVGDIEVLQRKIIEKQMGRKKPIIYNGDLEIS